MEMRFLNRKASLPGRLACQGCERKIARLLSFSLDHLDAHSFASVCHFAISFFWGGVESGRRGGGSKGERVTFARSGVSFDFTCCLLKFVLRVVCFLVGASALFVF